MSGGDFVSSVNEMDEERDYINMNISETGNDDRAEIKADTAMKDTTEQNYTEVPVTCSRKNEEVEETSSVVFYPPVYLQRYTRVREVLQNLLELPKYKNTLADGKTVMEVGCAEFGMKTQLTNIWDLNKIIFLDLDRQLLLDKAHFLNPLPAEYLKRRDSRPFPLVVEAYSGCITTVDTEVYRQNPKIWAVIGIEIIEHLYPEVLRGFVETVFGIFSPKIVIVTTPNSEFNQVFNLPPGKFRHWDHKFEWTREEFDSWCKAIISEFQEYKYSTEGIGAGSEETKHLGCVSQMAIFQKTETVLYSKDKNTTFSSRIQDGAWSLVHTTAYPSYKETRTAEQILLDEFNCYINYYVFSKSEIYRYDAMNIKEVCISFSRIQALEDVPAEAKNNQEFLRNVLSSKFNIKVINEEPNVVLNVEEFLRANFEDDSSSNDFDMDDDMDDKKLTESQLSKGMDSVTISNEESWE